MLILGLEGLKCKERNRCHPRLIGQSQAIFTAKRVICSFVHLPIKIDTLLEIQIIDCLVIFFHNFVWFQGNYWKFRAFK